jgi:hypothetical protein
VFTIVQTPAFVTTSMILSCGGMDIRGVICIFDAWVIVERIWTHDV